MSESGNRWGLTSVDHWPLEEQQNAGLPRKKPGAVQFENSLAVQAALRANSLIWVKAAASRTAISANTLRSKATLAWRSPYINRL